MAGRTTGRVPEYSPPGAKIPGFGFSFATAG